MKIKITASLIGLTLLLTSCSAQQVIDVPQNVRESARIRVLTFPNNDFYLFPAQACYTLPVEKNGISAHTGGKGYGVLNPLSVLGGNKKIGMPETDDMTWIHHEFRVPANKPLTLLTWYRSIGEVNHQFHYSNCGSIAGSFIPQAGEDYDAGLIFEDGRCYLRARQISKDLGIGKITTSEIALTPANSCSANK